MTGYDALVLIVVLASAAAGWVRGGTRELITLFSFLIAAIIALLILPLTGPLGRALVDPDWAGSIAAVAAGFFLIYFGIRIFGSRASKWMQDHAQFGPINRIVGIFVGALRGLFLIGVTHLVIHAAMPPEKAPGWLREAALYGVSAGAAKVIQAVLPPIGRGADTLAPVVGSSVQKGFSDGEALSAPQSQTTSPVDPAP